MKNFIVSIFTAALLLVSSLQIAHAEEEKSWVYVVTDGDNLWNITTKFLTKIDYYTQLQKLNNIKYPRRMKPGSVVRIPMEWIKNSPASAKISFIKGENQFIRNKISNPLTPSTTLLLGDEIRIGDNGSATVVFADGSEMVLFKNTIVAFDHLTSYGKTGMVDTRVRVIQGKVETNAQKNKGPGSRLDISTPSAISSVRGTVYRVSNTGNNISTVEVIEGTVAVAGEKANNTINVETGQGTRIEKGLEPTKPVPLLSGPRIQTTQTFFESPPVIQWEKIALAQQYKIQISTNKSFKNIVWDTSTSNNSISFPQLEDAKYYYRITAIDKLGIEGIPASNHFTVNLSPKAPELINTPERILGDTSLSTLQWNASADKVDNYQIEIAKDKNFTQLIKTQIQTNTQFTLPNELSFGQYYWRVSAIKNEDKGPASKPLSFNWITVLEAPNCVANYIDEKITISWPATKSNQTTTIEIAQDSEFTNLLKTYQLNSNTLSINYESTDEVFIRCKTSLHNSDVESQWSKTQHISQLDAGILSFFVTLLLVIII